MRLAIKIFAMLFILSFSEATAQDLPESDTPAQDRKIVYKQRTEIDFEGVEVAGELIRPQGSLVIERKRAKFNAMVKLRTDFDDEIGKSVDEVK